MMISLNPFFQVFFLNKKIIEKNLINAGCLNPFFQVFFLNVMIMANYLTREELSQSLFSGLLFKLGTAPTGLVSHSVSQSLFSGLLFKCAIFCIYLPLLVAGLNPFFQVFFLNVCIIYHFSRESCKVSIPFFRSSF